MSRTQSSLRVLLVSILMLLCSPGFAQVAAKPRVDFVYLGASDCPYCTAWEARDLPKLKSAGAFQDVRFTRVTKMIQSPVPSAFWFPAEVRHLRDPIAESLKGVGSPMFAVLSDGKVVAAWKGTSKKSEEILGLIAQASAQR